MFKLDMLHPSQYKHDLETGKVPKNKEPEKKDTELLKEHDFPRARYDEYYIPSTSDFISRR